MRLEDVLRVALPAETAVRLGRGDGLILRRAWPRSADHLLLEYADDEGRLVPGQWRRDAEGLRGVERETEGGVTALVGAPTGAIMLQVGGADRKLRGLAPTLAADGTVLLSHRPERRAVVRREKAGRTCYGKVFRRSRLAGKVAAHEHVARLRGRVFAVPEIAEVEERRGVVWFRAIEGRGLHDGTVGADAARSVGRALRSLHDADGPATPDAHDARAEADLLAAQLARLAVFAPDLAVVAEGVAPRVLEALTGGDSPAGLLHRDFYDKQIFIDDGGRVGLLDFDTLARGERALDLANMVAHLELRALQSRLDETAARATADAFLDGYEPIATVRDRIPAYLDATRLRLACLYAYRPRGAALGPLLIDRIGS